MTEPWGTPLETGEEEHLRFLSWTNCVRPVRYDCSQARGMSVILMEAVLRENQDGE